MRHTALVLLFVVFLLTGCANEGTVVRKDFRPLPAYFTYGFEGTYNFTLRTADGRLVSQMVTPNVFDRYVVGDYFNDLQPRASTFSEEPKLMRQVSVGRAAQDNCVALRPRSSKRGNKTQMVRAKTSQKGSLIAQRPLQRKSSRAVAAGRRRLPLPAVKVAQATKLPARVAARSVVPPSAPSMVNNDYTIVQIVRCR